MNRSNVLRGGVLAVSVLASSLLAGAVSAHVVLADPKAEPGAYYTSFFRVGHGCAGSATVALRVEIPEALATLRPQPKPGWTVSIERAPLATPAKGENGKTITERVSAVIWRGGPLPDDQWDQFGVTAKLPMKTGKLYFPTVQICESGETHWTETTAAPGQRLTHPAPTLEIAAGAGGDDMAGMDMSGMAMGDIGATRQHAAVRPRLTPTRARAGKGRIVVRDAWITAAPAGVPTAGGYLTLRNDGKTADTFLGGTTSAAASLELHAMSMTGGIMRMRPVEGGLPLPPGQSLALVPGGSHHLMLKGLRRALNPGDEVKATLRFAKAGEVIVIFDVRAR